MAARNNESEDPDKRKRYRRRLLKVLSWPLAVLILVYFLFEDLFLASLRPLFRFLGRLAFFSAVARGLHRLPPYVALCIIAVPFILIEPIKIFSLFWISLGHLVSGTVLLVASYVVSLFVVERLFHVMEGQLLSIGWFRWAYELTMRAKAWALGLLKATPIYRGLRPIAARAGRALRASVAWLKARVRRGFVSQG